MVDSLPDRCSTCRVVQLSNDPSTSMWLPPWLPEKVVRGGKEISREARGESMICLGRGRFLLSCEKAAISIPVEARSGFPQLPSLSERHACMHGFLTAWGRRKRHSTHIR